MALSTAGGVCNWMYRVGGAGMKWVDLWWVYIVTFESGAARKR